MSTYSSNLRIELITTGTQAGTWGDTTNSNYQYILEQAIAGNVSITTAAANQALTYLNGPSATPSANQSVRAILTLNTSTGANFAVYAPPVSKQYTIYNASSYTATIYNSTVIGNTTAAGTGVSIPAGKTIAVWSDGTSFYPQITYFDSITLNSPALTGVPTAPTAAPGTNTTQIATTAFSAAAITAERSAVATLTNKTINLASNTLVATSAQLAAAVTDETGTGALVFATSPTLVTPILGTPTSGTLTNCTGLPVSTGISGLGTGIATFLATPSSANLAAAITDETGSGALVFATSPSLTTPSMSSPTMTGTPTAPTAAPGTNTTQVATTAFVATSFAPLASPSLTGTPTAPTAVAGTNTTQIASTAFVTTAVANATSPLGTMSTQNANNVAITGGAINGTVIGGSNAVAVTGTTITATTQFSGPGTGLTGTASSLSIGGNATTATNATNATNATTSTTQSNGDNSTKIATTAYVQNMGLGWGQTWQNVTRTSGTTYYNTTGKPIFGVAGFNSFSNSMSVALSINGGTALTIASNFSGGSNYSGAAGAYIIPPGASYVLTFNNVSGYSPYIQELR